MIQKTFTVTRTLPGSGMATFVYRLEETVGDNMSSRNGRPLLGSKRHWWRRVQNMNRHMTAYVMDPQV